MTGVLHPDEVEAVLHRHHVGRLACVADGPSSVVPLAHPYGAVFGHTMPGRKVAAMRIQPHVCFEVDERWDDVTWRNVVAEGVYEEAPWFTPDRAAPPPMPARASTIRSRGLSL